MNQPQRVARQVDTATREIIVLLAQHSIRLTPAIIELLRPIIVRAVLEGTRMPANGNGAPRPAFHVVPREGAPWDEDTDPQRPSRRPKAE